MQTRELIVRGRAIRLNSRTATLVRTSVGTYEAHFLFDDAEWLDFPVIVTFSNSVASVSSSIILVEVTGSDEWSAESTVTIPHEVMGVVGPVRVTLQGTDSEGRHIITAKGAPLRVEEAGDVSVGTEPADAPTVDQWMQAYADAMVAVGKAASITEALQDRLESMLSGAEESLSEIVSNAEGSIGELLDNGLVTATEDRLGVVRIGDGLSVADDGLLSVSAGGLTSDQRSNLNLVVELLKSITTWSGGYVGGDTIVHEALPLASVTQAGAVKPDGVSVKVDRDGTISALAKTIVLATTSTAGAVKPDGTSITIDPDGTIHGTEQTPIATVSMAGRVKPDGTTITIDDDGTIHDATGYRYGYVHDSVRESKAFVFGDESDGEYEFVNLLSVQYGAFSGFQSIRAAFLPVCMTVSGNAFYGCSNLMSVSLPACSMVGGSAFYECTSLVSASVPVAKVIERDAFHSCLGLSSVNLPACTTVKDYAFLLCSGLGSISIPRCTTLGIGAFYNCTGLEAVSLPACTTVGERAFAYCGSISTVRLPSVTTIGPEAFFGCSSLKSVSLPTVVTIGSSAFYRCSSLASISLPKCETVNESAFYMCATLSTVSFPVCELVGRGAFEWCSTIKTVYLQACRSVLDMAFEHCSRMTYADLPICTTIGRSAFRDCYNLISLYLTGISQVPTLGSDAFYSTPIGGYSSVAGRYGRVYVPRSLYGDFWEADGWSGIVPRLVSY